jgi:hypothetical protein
MGCLLPDSTVNLQNATQCKKCHGTYQPIFTWNKVFIFILFYFVCVAYNTKGDWVKGKQLAMTWEAKNYTNENVWRQTLDYNIITDTVNRVIAQKFSLAVQTEVYKNKYNNFVTSKVASYFRSY